MEIDQKIKEEKTETLEKLLAELYCLVEELERKVRENRHRSQQKTETSPEAIAITPASG